MGLRSILGLTTEAAASAQVAEIAAVTNHNELLQERLADLELALEDQGWTRLLTDGRQEFSRSGLQRATELARIMAVQNPLIRRGISIRTGYVWGQGVQIEARAKGDSGDQDVNTVIQGFLDDPLNERVLDGDELERTLATDGNLFLSLVTSPLSGRVQVRDIPFDEVDDIITNPDDRYDVWFYHRTWYDGTQQREALYPDIHHRPRSRHVSADGVTIHWDKPVIHAKVNGLRGWKFGIGDIYPVMVWARAYKDFLGDWTTLVKALSRFAFRATTPGSKAQQTREKLAATPSTSAQTSAPNHAGATAILGPGQSLEAIPKTGATIDSESGKPVAAMVATGLDIPVTMLLSDPGQTGARAVAETLDKATEYPMLQRRRLWDRLLLKVLNHVIDSSVRAPRGQLKGTIRVDRETGHETITLAGDTDRTIDITRGDLTTTPIDVLVNAIVAADSTQLMPDEQTVRLLLHALGVNDVDEIIEAMLDDDGNFPTRDQLDPYTQTPDPEPEPVPGDDDGDQPQNS